MKKKHQSKWKVAVAVALALLMVPQGVVGAGGQMSVSFPATTSQSASKDVQLPQWATVTSVTTNTGSVSYEQTGDNLLVNVSGGAAVGSSYNSTKYSQYVTSSQTSSGTYFPYSLNYNSGGYSGTIYQNGSYYQSSGSYTPGDTKWVTGQTSSSYNSGGYSGSLSQYVYSGSLVASQQKTITSYASGTYTWGWHCSSQILQWKPESENKPSSSIWYSDSGGFSGWLSLKTWAGTHPLDGTYCNGVVMKKYLNNYTYTGTVRTQAVDTRVYRYQGNVTKPASDTRIYTQLYAGNVYSGGYDPTYAYTVTVNYNVDSDGPTGTIVPEKTGWTNESYLLTLTDINDVDISGVKHVVMPNGLAMPVQEGEDVSYMVSQNGTYSFTLVDNAGNRAVKSHAVTNIDKTLPSGSLSYDNSQLEQGMKMTLNASDGLSGLESIKMPDGTLVDGPQAIYYTSEPGNHDFEVTDQAGNVRVVTGNAKSPVFTVTRSNLSYVVSVSRQYYSVMPTITHLETGEVYTGTYKTFPITKNGTYSFEVNDGGIKRTEVVEMNDYYNLVVPKVTITYPDNGWTQSSVRLYVRVTSEIGKTISGIVLPDGTVTTRNYAYYYVSENGIYTFQGFDSDGTYGYGSVKITNIDSKAPTIEFTTPEDWVTEDPTIALNVAEE